MTSEPTDLECLYALLGEQGLSDDQISAAIRVSPGMTETLALPIARKRAELAQQAVEDAKAEYAASPAGRAEGARAALQAQAERAELVAGARALLEQDGGSAEGLSDERVLHLTGIEPSAEQMTLRERDEAQLELALRWRTLSPLEQSQQAQALGIESASIERYVCDFIEDGSGDEGGEV
jgi:hypothetical protein